jgi:uncharacterized membrane protein YhaH (DUF805 family)
MKGEVLNYDDNTGNGQISGADGIRYSFTRADLKQLMPISRGSRVDFDFEGKQAKDIYLDPSASQAPAYGSPASAQGASGPYSGPVEPDLGFWGYFIRAYTGKFASFSGRARRKEYWSLVLFSVIIGIILSSLFIAGIGSHLNELTGTKDPQEIARLITSSPLVLTGVILLVLFGLLSILPGLGMLVRRLHDIGLSGWIALLLILAGLIPVVGLISSIATLVIACINSQPFVNKYGPPPKAV